MNRRVMIVDDDKEFMEELGETMALSGYELLPVGDATKVLDAAVSEKPDVILLDLKMPKMSGFQVADELRSLSEVSHIPIIAMSAYYKDNYQNLLEMCGIKRCLKKPFQPLDVITEIEKVLSEEERRP